MKSILLGRPASRNNLRPSARFVPAVPWLRAAFFAVFTFRVFGALRLGLLPWQAVAAVGQRGERPRLNLVRLRRLRKVDHVCFPKLTQAICRRSLKMRICHGNFRKGASPGMGTRRRCSDFNYCLEIAPRSIVTTCSTVRLAVSITMCSRLHGR